MSEHHEPVDPRLWRRLDPAGLSERPFDGVRGSAPPGFAAQVMVRVRAEAEGAGGWRWAPVWAKAAAAAALLVGLVVGAGLANWATQPSAVTAESELDMGFGESLGEAYWRALEDGDDGADGWTLVDPAGAGQAGDVWQ